MILSGEARCGNLRDSQFVNKGNSVHCNLYLLVVLNVHDNEGILFIGLDVLFSS